MGSVWVRTHRVCGGMASNHTATRELEMRSSVLYKSGWWRKGEQHSGGRHGHQHNLILLHNSAQSDSRASPPTVCLPRGKIMFIVSPWQLLPDEEIRAWWDGREKGANVIDSFEPPLIRNSSSGGMPQEISIFVSHAVPNWSSSELQHGRQDLPLVVQTAARVSA